MGWASGGALALFPGRLLDRDRVEGGGPPPRDWIDTLMNERDLRPCIDCRESESNEERRVAFGKEREGPRGAERGRERGAEEIERPREAIMSSAMPRNCLRFEATSAAASGAEEQRPVPRLNGSRDNLGETNLLRRERNESAGILGFLFSCCRTEVLEITNRGTVPAARCDRPRSTGPVLI